MKNIRYCSCIARVCVCVCRLEYPIDKDKSNCELNMREMRTARRDVRVYFNVCIGTCVCFMHMEN